MNKRTNGAVTIRVFPSEQLGKEADLVQQVKSGALDISAPSMAGDVLAWCRRWRWQARPFLWHDWKEAEAVIRGAAFDPLFDELRDKHNIVPLTRIWYWGWRNFTFTDREVRKPEDMAGLKIRVPESPIWVEMIRAFGAAPTPIPFGEVYTALQQKTVDGQENPIPTIYSRKFYEVQGVLTMTRHMLQNNTIMINKDSLARLSPEHQKILMEEAAARLGEEHRAAAGPRGAHAGGDPQVRPHQGHRRSRPRRLPGQDEARLCDALEARWGAENLKRAARGDRQDPRQLGSRGHAAGALRRLDDGVGRVEDALPRRARTASSPRSSSRRCSSATCSTTR